MREGGKQPVSRRALLKLIGTVAGSTAMHSAMTQMGLAQEPGYSHPRNWVERVQ